MAKFVAVILLFIILSPAGVAAPGASETTENSALSQQKLALEIEKLKKEISTVIIGPWLQMGTVVIALLAAGISFWSAWRAQASNAASLQAQIEATRKDRISHLLKELGSEHGAVRAATVQALGEYDTALPYLINLLKYENDDNVIDTILPIISSSGCQALTLLLDHARRISRRKTWVAGALSAMGSDMDEIATVTAISKSYFARWKDSAYGKRYINNFRRRLELHGPDKTEWIATLQRESLQKNDALSSAYRNILLGIEATLKTISQSGKSITISDTYLDGVVLDTLDISEWTFHDCILSNASFRNTIAKKAVFKSSLLDGASFKGADLRDAVLDGCEINKASFAKSTLVRTSLKHVKAYSTSFFMAKIRQTNFFGASLVQTDFGKAKGEAIVFASASLMGANFESAILVRSKFNHARLNGANLSDAHANGAVFDNANMSGAILTRTNCHAASFSRTILSAIDAFQDADFHDAVLDDLSTYYKLNEHFSDYLCDQLAA